MATVDNPSDRAEGPGLAMQASRCSPTLIVEDDVDFAAWLADSLQAAFPKADIRRAGNVAQARAQLLECKPRLAIIDLHLPDGSGTDVVASIAQRVPAASILVVTAVEDGIEAMAAIRAGAQGYVVKSRSNWDLIQTVNEVLDGGSPITPIIARRVLQELAGHGAADQGTAAAAGSPADSPAGGEADGDALKRGLTHREAEIFRLAASGYRNKEIANRLDLSVNTVATHIKAVYRKLSVSSRSHLRNLLKPDD